MLSACHLHKLSQLFQLGSSDAIKDLCVTAGVRSLQVTIEHIQKPAGGQLIPSGTGTGVFVCMSVSIYIYICIYIYGTALPGRPPMVMGQTSTPCGFMVGCGLACPGGGGAGVSGCEFRGRGEGGTVGAKIYIYIYINYVRVCACTSVCVFERLYV